MILVHLIVFYRADKCETLFFEQREPALAKYEELSLDEKIDRLFLFECEKPRLQCEPRLTKRILEMSRASQRDPEKEEKLKALAEAKALLEREKAHEADLERARELLGAGSDHRSAIAVSSVRPETTRSAKTIPAPEEKELFVQGDDADEARSHFISRP